MDTTKAVLVTGASTGIGRKLTERLAALGCLVYAAARKEEDIRALAAIPSVVSLRMDVTSPSQIAAAVDLVTRAGRGLYGLVNNAGIATMGNIVDGSDAEFDLVMAVNVQGTYRVTKAFAPLIMAQRGRIVMIGSIASFIASAGLCAYSMSKLAIEAFTDCLALEMQPHGVKVSIIEPGMFASQLARNAITRLGIDPGLPNLLQYSEPAEVSLAVAQALLEPEPRRRYLAVSSEREARITIAKQIEQLVQMNAWQRYSYQRHAILEMLDDALQRSLPRS